MTVSRCFPRMIALVAFGAGFLTYAQTPATRVARFDTLFKSSTTHRYARMAWQKESVNNRKPDFAQTAGEGSDIVAMDTKDGIVRTLKAGWPTATANVTAHLSSATLTPDGTRVIYYDNTNHTIRIVNWDGTKDTVLIANFEGEGRCWRSSDGKQWVLATEYKDTATDAKLYRINIDNTSEKVLLFTSGWARSGSAGSITWASLSADGKVLVAGFPNTILGLVNVSTPPPTDFTSMNPIGWSPTLSPDNNCEILFRDQGSFSGKTFMIMDTTQAPLIYKNLATKGVMASTDCYDGVRWSNDTNFMSVFSSKYSGGIFDASNTSNPKVIRISDMAFVAVNDSCMTAQGNCDLQFYSETGVANPRAVRLAVGVARGNASGGMVFDLRGRGVTALTKANHGVFIAVSPGNASSARRFCNARSAL